MGKKFEGHFDARGKQIAIVASRFNDFFTRELMDGAQDCLRRHGVTEEQIDIAWVPGGFEVPLVAKRFVESGRYAAVICLGALIRGATPHFDHIASAATAGISQVALRTGVPALYGVLTCDTIEQAIERAGTKAGNKGAEAALSVVEMANLMRELGN